MPWQEDVDVKNDKERWAEALVIENQWASDANNHVAERVTELALLGDMQRVDRYISIGNLLDQLAFSPGSTIH